MAHILIMPRQGNTVESCVIVDWKAREGDRVTAESPLCEVETDKATFEVAAGAAGIVLKLLHKVGEDVPVLAPIAVIGEKGETWENSLTEGVVGKTGTGAVPAPKTAEAKSETAGPSSPPASPGGPASPRARVLADHEALNITGLEGTGPGGRIIERDVREALEGLPPLTARAKAELTARGLPRPAAGSGLGGRVTVSDLERPLPDSRMSVPPAGPSQAAPQSAAASTEAGEGRITETAVKGIRKLIATRMHESLSTTAQFSLSSSADARRLEATRARFKESELDLGLSKITINDLVLFAVARTLPRYPFMNALKTGDTLREFERVHLGMAVDTPRGLMVPVIRNANLLSLPRLSAEAKRLAAACQGGTAKPDELSGSTFTVTNLGALGVETFTPVLNAPEVAILGVCAIVPRPGLDADGRMNVIPRLGLSLTINHQVVDGAPAARFLQGLQAAIADIDLYLVR